MTMDRARQVTLFLLRVVSGLLLLQAGGMKLFDWFGGVPAQYGGHPPIWSQMWIGGVLEFYGGAAILLGLFTQPVAFILSGIFPGLGQLYNRQPAKGAAFVVAGVVLSWLFLRAAPSDQALPRRHPHPTRPSRQMPAAADRALHRVPEAAVRGGAACQAASESSTPTMPRHRPPPKIKSMSLHDSLQGLDNTLARTS